MVKRIIEEMNSPEAKPFGIKKVKTFFNEHPDVFKLNSHITRNDGLIKSLQNDAEALSKGILV